MSTLIVYQVAIDLVRELRPIIVELQKRDTNLDDQLRRAATSVIANLAEGQRRLKGNKQRAYQIAHGEARVSDRAW
jgi:four helix bundle protein